MSLALETQEKQKPIILIFGNHLLVLELLEEYSKDFKVAYVGDIVEDGSGEDFYRIGRTNAQFIKNLEEKIDYAVIFLSGESDKTLIPHILEKIVKDATHTAIIVNIETIENFYDVLLEYKRIPTLKFLFIGDIYSENPPFNTASPVSKIIHQAIFKRYLTLPSDLEPIFTIYHKDAIAGINQILFGPARNASHSDAGGPIKKGAFYYLFYSEPQTINSIAYILRRIEHDLEIHYEEAEEKVKTRSHSQLSKEIKSKIVSEPVPLDKYFIGFEKSLANFSKDSFHERTDSTVKGKIIGRAKGFPRNAAIKPLILSFTLAAAIFVILNMFFVGLGLFELRTSARAFQKGEYKKASSSARNASSFLSFSEPVALLSAKLARWDFNRVQETLSLMNIVSDSFASFSKMTQGLPRETLDRTISDGTYFYFRFQGLKSELKRGPQNLFWGEKNETLNTLETLDLSNIISLAPLLPTILGYNEERNYLVLFQNNGELRPTGGFIGSIGELKLRSGKAEISIQDVYEYDGKLRAHVEPHYIVRRYLQPHLYLRDSNFDPDFRKTASTSALLYNLETGKKVDGVIAVNFEAVRRLISEVGPVELAAYKKTLDEKNTFDFLQETIDDNFFPGSTQKRDVLTSLFNQLILKLENEDKLIRAARLLPKLLNEKHIIFAFDSSSIQSIFNNLGYGGILNDKRNIEEGRLNDFLAINEANIGVNKANINVTRETEYKITLENRTTSQVLHTLKNSGDKEYKAYIRIFTPLGSRLTSINFGEEKQNVVSAVTDFRVYERRNFKPPAALEVDQSIDGRFQVFGFIVSVASKSTKKIEVNYNNGIILPKESIVTYSLSVIKQPGIERYPFNLKLSYGEKFVPKEVENARLSDGNIEIIEDLVSDREFIAELIRR